MKTKKIKFLILGLSSLILSSCDFNNQKRTQEEISATTVKDSMENIFQSTLAEINSNLNIIKEKEGLVAMKRHKDGEIVSTAKEEVLQNIADINNLLEQNRKKMDDLDLQISSFNGEKKHWKRQVEKMATLMKQKENDLLALKQELEQSRQEVNYLSETNKGLSQKINENTEAISTLQSEKKSADEGSVKLNNELHKAYYTQGTYKELKLHNVLQKEGGVLGIGRTETLKPDFEKSYFTEIDTRSATDITIAGEKAKLITHHPVNSYELKSENKELAHLIITDPDKFWGASKYLVVEVASK